MDADMNPAKYLPSCPSTKDMGYISIRIRAGGPNPGAKPAFALRTLLVLQYLSTVICCYFNPHNSPSPIGKARHLDMTLQYCRTSRLHS